MKKKTVKKKNIILLPCALMISLTFCSSDYLTPDKALGGLHSAFLKHDVKHMRRILSENSIAKTAALRENLASLDDKQAESVSKLYGLSAQELKSASEEELLSIFIFWQKNVIFRGDSSIDEVVESGNNAVVRLRNGNELDFVKEGPYWKFDLSRL
ncbi:MAG: hypothetical protein FWG92_05405 [Leptospirales bacterium]|nr:hypothetical protein [Leptospirales bacterium]